MRVRCAYLPQNLRYTTTPLSGIQAGCQESEARPPMPSVSASRHDLSLNLENSIVKQLRRLRVILLPVLLALFVGCAGTATQESTGDYIDDTVLTTKPGLFIKAGDSRSTN